MKIQKLETLEQSIPLSAVKAHLRVDFSDEDDVIRMYFTAALSYIENVCKTVLERSRFTAIGSQFDLCFKGYPDPEISRVFYKDGAGEIRDVENYDILNGCLSLSEPSDLLSATVEFTAGYEEPPQYLIHAVLMLTSSFYEERADTVDYNVQSVPAGVTRLIGAYRSFAHG